MSMSGSAFFKDIVVDVDISIVFSRVNPNSSRNILCEVLEKKGTELTDSTGLPVFNDYHWSDTCRYCHHPSVLFQKKKVMTQKHWRHYSYQLWVLQFTDLETVPAIKKEMEALFKQIIEDPAVELQPAVAWYKTKLQEEQDKLKLAKQEAKQRLEREARQQEENQAHEAILASQEADATSGQELTAKYEELILLHPQLCGDLFAHIPKVREMIFDMNMTVLRLDSVFRNPLVSGLRLRMDCADFPTDQQWLKWLHNLLDFVAALYKLQNLKTSTSTKAKLADRIASAEKNVISLQTVDRMDEKLCVLIEWFEAHPEVNTTVNTTVTPLKEVSTTQLTSTEVINVLDTIVPEDNQFIPVVNIDTYHQCFSFTAEDVQSLRACCKNESELRIPAFCCDQCDEVFCRSCVDDHTAEFAKRNHTITAHLCPRCANYRHLQLCYHCSPGESIRCGDCHRRYHNKAAVKHTYQEYVFDQKLLRCENSTSTALPTPTTLTLSVPSPPTPPTPVPPPVPARVASVPKPSVPVDPFDVSDVTSTTAQTLFMARSRCLLEDVAHEILYQLLRLKWMQGKNYCPGCKAYHLFENMPNIARCLTRLVVRYLDFSGTVRALQDHGHMNYTGLRTHFDITALKGLLESWSEYSLYYKHDVLFSVSNLEVLRKWRNKTMHPLQLSHTDYIDCFDEVVTACRATLSTMNASANRDHEYKEWLTKFTFENKCIECKTAITSRLELSVYVKEAWQKEIRHADMHTLAMYLSSLKDQTDTAKIIADRLCATSNANTLKILIIPRFKDGWAITPAAQQLFGFLKLVSWAAIHDLNEEPIWPHDADFSVDVERENRDAFIYSGDVYGKLKLLYTRDQSPLHYLLALKRTWEGYVLCFGDVDCDENSIFDLRSALKPLQTVFKSGHSSPVLDNCNSLLPLIDKDNKTYVELFEQTKCLGQKIQTDNGKERLLNAEEQVQYLAHLSCSIHVVSNIVLGLKRQPGALLFQSHVLNCFVGEPREFLLPYEKYAEVLSIGFDSMPVSTSLSSLGNDLMTVNEELDSFVRGGLASWYLLAQQPRKVVQRQQLSELLDLIDQVDRSPQAVYLVHHYGLGGTTLARNVMYELAKRGTVCVVLKEVIHLKATCDSLKNALRKLHELTGHRVVMLFDFKSKKHNEFINNMKASFCTLLVTTSDRDCLNTYSQPSTDSTTVSRDTVVVELSPLNQDEERHFAALIDSIVGKQQINVLGHVFVADAFGRLVHDVISPEGMKVIRNTDDSILNRAGFSWMDISKLKNDVRQIAWYTLPTNNVTGEVYFYSLMAFVPAYRVQVKAHTDEMIAKFTTSQLLVLRLCVFYALFMPTMVVSKHIASYFNSGVEISAKSVVWPKHMLEFIFTDFEGNLAIKSPQLSYILAENMHVFGYDTRYAVKVNKTTSSVTSSDVQLDINYDKVINFINVELFPRLKISNNTNNKEHSSTITSDVRLTGILLAEAAEALTVGFCYFKVWHPGCVPKQHNNTKPTLDNSFLVELLLRIRAKKDDNFERIVSLFTSIISTYSHWDYTNIPNMDAVTHNDIVSTFTTHAARFISYRAQVKMDFSLIQRAHDLTDSLSNIGRQVYECRGNTHKRAVIIFLKLSKNRIFRRNEAMKLQESDAEMSEDDELLEEEEENQINDGEAVSAGSEEYCVDELAAQANSLLTLNVEIELNSEARAYISEALQFHKAICTASINHKPSERVLSSFSALIDEAENVYNIVEESFVWFHKADIVHKGSNAFPMIASVQTGVYFLLYLRNQLCQGNTEHFVYLQQRYKQCNVPKLTTFLNKVFCRKPLSIFDHCTYLLDKARKSIKNLALNSEYSHSHTVTTSKYINRYLRDLDSFYETKRERFAELNASTVEFRITKVSLLMPRGNVITELTCKQLAYCLATCCLTMQQYQSQRASAHSNTSTDVDEDDAARKKMFFSAVEKMYLASSRLSYMQIYASEEVNTTVTSFLRAAGVSTDSSVWSTLFLRDSIHQWLESIQSEFQEATNGMESTLSNKSGEIRSYYGIDAHMMLVALNLCHALSLPEGSDLASEVEMLRTSLDNLKEFSDKSQHIFVPRVFLADGDGGVLPHNPFMRIMHIEHMNWYNAEIRGKSSGEERECGYRENRRFFRQLHGTFLLDGNGYTSVRCNELDGLNIKCERGVYKDMFRSGDNVVFVVVIANEGIWAHGLSHRNKRR